MKVTVVPPEDPAVVRERCGLGNNSCRDDSRWRGDAPSINALFTGEMVEDGGGADGWFVVHSQDNKDENGGVTSHRGVLHPDEYVDEDLLQQMIEDELGFTYEQIRSAYPDTPGSVSLPLRELRSQIDARLLALLRAGGNMLAFARALGWSVSVNSRTRRPDCRKMDRALARARKAEAA